MARINNQRNLRSSVWANHTFCSFCAKKERVVSWTKRLQATKGSFSFINKVLVKKNKNKKKKRSI
jgi:hypothetical protein